ncbi:MAG: hypothetical protein QJ16_C0019G0001, partial [archaeon GW2011_AR1]
MSYVKKLVMHGFKSFPRKTELPFTPGINVILGPNGSGKSNITDALCFVLGRLSIKSMRAAKASNLLFMGTKVASPSKEASVEIVFDNTNNIFGTNEEEISIKRIVRKNGQSIYKINNETKTRQEVLSILAQAGIDPNGFNIVLQGEIQNFVRMQSEERRKVIEEVAGISIYESRKEKSIKELEKTEEKLKEVSAILKERNSYLSNLEKEREAALKHKKLEEDVRKFKKSIFFSDLTKKKNESEEINKEIENKGKESEKIKKVIISFETEIETLEEKISEINSKIQKQTGLEQEKLNREISNLRAELAGLYVKKENHEKKLKEIDRKKLSLQSSMEENEVSIKNLQKESPTIEKNQKELLVKKRELEVLEGLIKKRYINKSELKSIKERLDDKKELLNNSNNESNFLIEQIESLSSELFDKKTDEKKVEELRLNLKEKNELLNQFEKREREIEKIISVNNSKIEEHKKIIEKVGKLDICPLCKSKITEDHIKSIREEANPKIENFEKEIRGAELEIKEILSKRNSLKREVESISFEINKRQSDISKLNLIHEKNIQVKNLTEKINSGKNEIIELIKNKKKLEDNFDENSNVEEKYETLKIEVEEISLRNKENLSSEISFKQREFERTIISLKQLSREKDELLEELEGIEKSLSEKEKNLEIKRKEEEELTKKAKKYIEERDSFQQKIRDTELDLSEKRNSIYNLEQINNNLKIERAKKDAEVENLETEILEFPEAEIIRMSRDALIEKLKKSEETLIRIGTVNMRALEVYDEI